MSGDGRLAQRQSDLRILRELCEEGEVEGTSLDVPEAFYEMLVRLDERMQETLTPKQRKWVNAVAARSGFIEESEGPEDDGGPEPTRLTSGPVPRGREVPILVRDKPLRPPGRPMHDILFPEEKYRSGKK
jgi:hypothetical protein